MSPRLWGRLNPPQRHPGEDRLDHLCDLMAKIPKAACRVVFPSLLAPRRRIDVALYAVVMEAYVHGVSTCKVDDLVAALGVDAGSPSLRFPDLHRPGHGGTDRGVLAWAVTDREAPRVGALPGRAWCAPGAGAGPVGRSGSGGAGPEGAARAPSQRPVTSARTLRRCGRSRCGTRPPECSQPPSQGSTSNKPLSP